MPLFAISAHDIDAAGLPVDRDLPTDWLGRELEDAALTAEKPGHVTARLSRTGNDIIVRGKVLADLTTPCARCLAPTHLHVDGDLSLLLRPTAPVRTEGHGHGHAAKKANGDAHKSQKDREKELEEEYEFSSADADVDAYDGETVVLDPFVREAILLEIPNFPLCSEACPGIRPAQAERAEPAPTLDPRLAPLDALRAKLAARGSDPKPPSEPTAAPSPRTKKKNKE